MQKTISIEGMHCQHCVAAVTSALEELKGVSKVAVSLEHNNAVIEVDGITDAAIKEAIEDIGFDVTGIK